MLQSIHDKSLDTAEWDPQEWDPRITPRFSEEQYALWRKEVSYYLYLNAMVKVLNPRKILELGTNEGQSALFMFLALSEDAELITVENAVENPPNLKMCASDPRLRIVYGDSLDLSCYNGIDLHGVDLLFIDTEHQYEQVSKEWEIYHKFLNKGAIVALDDTRINEGMMQFFEELPYTKIETWLHNTGFGVFQYE